MNVEFVTIGILFLVNLIQAFIISKWMNRANKSEELNAKTLALNEKILRINRDLIATNDNLININNRMIEKEKK